MSNERTLTEKRSESFFRLSYNTFGCFCILVKQIAILYSKLGYMLCKKYGVDTQNFAIDRIPDELKNKEPKNIKAELSKTQKAFKEITARVSDELYRQRAERSKEQGR